MGKTIKVSQKKLKRMIAVYTETGSITKVMKVSKIKGYAVNEKILEPYIDEIRKCWCDDARKKAKEHMQKYRNLWRHEDA